MERVVPEAKQNKISYTKSRSTTSGNISTTLWDCGSTLYDSFELNSFKRQINSAIANSPRSFSMSHLPARCVPLPPQPQPQPQPPSSSSIVSKKPFKISRSFQKLLRSVFKSSNKSTMSSTTTTTSSFQVPEKYSKERFYVVYDKSGPVLSTIPEVPEFENSIGALSPEISSFVGRSSSERFAATTAIGISCA